MKIGDRIRVCQGWADEGRTGKLLAIVSVGEKWAVVLWDRQDHETIADDKPDLHKLSGIENAQRGGLCVT